MGRVASCFGGASHSKSLTFNGMDMQQLKLAIIQRVTSCKDEQLLRTIHQLLDQLDGNTGDYSSSPQLLAAILGEKGTTTASSSQQTSANQDDIDDLQRSINDVFGTE